MGRKKNGTGRNAPEAPEAPAGRGTAGLEEALGHGFRDAGLLRAALLHRSAAVERGMGGWAESQRLEFLGDAVLDLLAADWLMSHLPPDTREGRLTQLRSRLTCTASFAAVARRLGLGACVELGVGEERGGGRGRDALLADTLEAVFGAVWRDGGWAAADAAFRRVFAGELAEAAAGADSAAAAGNPKGLLQEFAQARGDGVPAYGVVSEEGPPHARRYAVDVRVAGLSARGAGPSKHQAEEEAAREWMRLHARMNPGGAGVVEPLDSAGRPAPHGTEHPS